MLLLLLLSHRRVSCSLAKHRHPLPLTARHSVQDTAHNHAQHKHTQHVGNILSLATVLVKFGLGQLVLTLIANSHVCLCVQLTKLLTFFLRGNYVTAHLSGSRAGERGGPPEHEGLGHPNTRGSSHPDIRGTGHPNKL